MTVETLNYMMTYVVEGWGLLSTAYLGVGFTTSFVSRAQHDLKSQSMSVAQADVNEVTNAERVAEMTAVAEKYAKSSDTQKIQSSVTISE